MEFLYVALGLVALSLFAHLIALMAMSPIFYFLASPSSKRARWMALLIGTPALWLFLFSSSFYVGQNFRNSASVGILAGATVSTSLIFYSVATKRDENRTWLLVAMVFVLPALGYLAGAQFDTVGSLGAS